MTDPEVPLTGGSMSDVVRVRTTVRRPAGPWTPTVHRLLAHLRAAGVDVVPRPHGLDDRGREVLDHLPGDVAQHPLPAWVWDDGVLVSAARCLSRVHAASAGFDRTGGRWRVPTHEPDEVVCHNDFAPYNLVFSRAREVVGVIDWDTASPGPRAWDLAYLAYRLVPLADPRNADARASDLAERRRRLDLLLATYRPVLDAAHVLATAVERLEDLAGFTAARAAAGRPELHAHADLYRRDAAWLRAHAARLLHRQRPPAAGQKPVSSTG